MSTELVFPDHYSMTAINTVIVNKKILISDENIKNVIDKIKIHPEISRIIKRLNIKDWEIKSNYKGHKVNDYCEKCGFSLCEKNRIDLFDLVIYVKCKIDRSRATFKSDKTGIVYMKTETKISNELFAAGESPIPRYQTYNVMTIGYRLYDFPSYQQNLFDIFKEIRVAP